MIVIVKRDDDDGLFVHKTIVQATVQFSPTWRSGGTDKKNRRREWDKEKQNCRRGQYFLVIMEMLIMMINVATVKIQNWTQKSKIAEDVKAEIIKVQEIF